MGKLIRRERRCGLQLVRTLTPSTSWHMMQEASSSTLRLFSKILLHTVVIQALQPRSILGEPGEQAAGGVWEGMDVDKEVGQFALDNGYGGAMIWAANPNPVQAPKGATLCPQLASELNKILKPTYAWGAAKWTKCTSSGWWPSLDVVV